nr:MAG TPA: hypothetical protein [Caudoviricetes sp.]
MFRPLVYTSHPRIREYIGKSRLFCTLLPAELHTYTSNASKTLYYCASLL